jgi:hypothetical protein
MFTWDRDETGLQVRADWLAWIQTGMNINTKTFQTGLGCNLDIATTHANKSHLKKKIAWRGEQIEHFVIFVPVSCTHVDNFNFHSGLTSSRSHVNRALARIVRPHIATIALKFNVMPPVALRPKARTCFRILILPKSTSPFHRCDLILILTLMIQVYGT